ncbi:hypothetical protein ACFFMP_02780 [Pseudoroseomonas cervicalis]|uniref:hypothetical protein n=1 Tax=Teichococcus cervicalis TaxID=204525 RepID=UPI0035E86ABD
MARPQLRRQRRHRQGAQGRQRRLALAARHLQLGQAQPQRRGALAARGGATQQLGRRLVEVERRQPLGDAQRRRVQRLARRQLVLAADEGLRRLQHRRRRVVQHAEQRAPGARPHLLGGIGKQLLGLLQQRQRALVLARLLIELGGAEPPGQLARIAAPAGDGGLQHGGRRARLQPAAGQPGLGDAAARAVADVAVAPLGQRLIGRQGGVEIAARLGQPGAGEGIGRALHRPGRVQQRRGLAQGAGLGQAARHRRQQPVAQRGGVAQQHRRGARQGGGQRRIGRRLPGELQAGEGAPQRHLPLRRQAGILERRQRLLGAAGQQGAGGQQQQGARLAGQARILLQRQLGQRLGLGAEAERQQRLGQLQPQRAARQRRRHGQFGEKGAAALQQRRRLLLRQGQQARQFVGGHRHAPLHRADRQRAAGGERDGEALRHAAQLHRGLARGNGHALIGGQQVEGGEGRADRQAARRRRQQAEQQQPARRLGVRHGDDTPRGPSAQQQARCRALLLVEADGVAAGGPGRVQHPDAVGVAAQRRHWRARDERQAQHGAAGHLQRLQPGQRRGEAAQRGEVGRLGIVESQQQRAAALQRGGGGGAAEGQRHRRRAGGTGRAWRRRGLSDAGAGAAAGGRA